MTGLGNAVGGLIGAPVHIGDPFKRVKVARRIDAEDNAGSLAVAIGLGIEDWTMRAVDLLPRDEQRARSRGGAQDVPRRRRRSGRGDGRIHVLLVVVASGTAEERRDGSSPQSRPRSQTCPRLPIPR